MPSLICTGAGDDEHSSSSGIVRMILGANRMSKRRKIGSGKSRRDWDLTGDAWDGFLLCLDDDRDRAAEKYEKIRQKLIKFFEWKNLQQAEDLTDETLNRVARRIEEGLEIHAADPFAYIYRVALLIAKEAFRDRQRTARALHEHGFQREVLDEPEPEADVRLECLRQCIANLPDAQKQLVLQYHAVESKDRIPQRRRLAAQLHLPLNALRIRACRIRARLEDCVEARLRARQESSL
jgi:DNA-directed RNA polymerase specialized sigma24 family protein